MIIGLTGRIAAGKERIRLFLEKEGFEYYTVSDVVREEAAKRSIPIERKCLQDLGNKVRKEEGAGAWMKKLIIRLAPGKNYVIDGIRNPGEVEELRKQKNFYLIAVDASQKKRYKRFLERAKSSDPKTWQGFLEIDKRDFGEEDQLGQQVGKCMKMADFYIMNNSDLKTLNMRTKEIYNQIKSLCR